MTTIVNVQNEATSHNNVVVKQTGGDPDVVLLPGHQTRFTLHSGNTFSVEEVVVEAQVAPTPEVPPAPEPAPAPADAPEAAPEVPPASEGEAEKAPE